VDVAAGWRLHASFGTGFRAPTLYQRFSEYGSPALAPESSRNVDLGLQRSGTDSRLALTAFHNRINDLIIFGSPGPCADSFGCYGNAPGESRLSGLTLEASKTWLGLRSSGSVDFLSAKNATTGRQLARRARRTASLRLDKDIGDWTVGGQWLLVGKRFDDAANSRGLGGYGVLNLDAQVRLNNEWRLQARLDNAFDKDYSTARNFISAPRSLFVGVRWSPKL
jgi:vitamin B12 transporter